jgi:hypothetical protein
MACCGAHVLNILLWSRLHSIIEDCKKSCSLHPHHSTVVCLIQNVRWHDHYMYFVPSLCWWIITLRCRCIMVTVLWLISEYDAFVKPSQHESWNSPPRHEYWNSLSQQITTLCHCWWLWVCTVSARIISTPMMVNISKSNWPILMRFAAYERKFCWPHLEIKIMVIAKYHAYAISCKKSLKIKILQVFYFWCFYILQSFWFLKVF